MKLLFLHCRYMTALSEGFWSFSRRLKHIGYKVSGTGLSDDGQTNHETPDTLDFKLRRQQVHCLRTFTDDRGAKLTRLIVRSCHLVAPFA
jgi:hypothetical protein